VDSRTIRPKRSVRHAAAAAERPAPTVSRRHHKRAERERRLRLGVLAGVVTVVLIAIFIPAYGYYREVLRIGDQPAAIVDGQTFSLADYARYVGTWQAILARQMGQLQAIAYPPGAKPTDTPTPEQLAAQTSLQTLQSEQSGLASTALSQLAEAKLVQDEAQTRGLTASQAELDNALRWLMSPPLSSAALESGVEPAPATLPITNTVSLDEAKQGLNKIVGNGQFLSADQVTNLVVKPAVLKEKLVAALSGPVPTTEEEVHARHILVATEADAQAARKQIVDGADYAAVAAKVSTDTSNKDKGGDLGWFGRGAMVPEFETAAFSLKVGEISQPVKSSFGYHIIQVLEKDPQHPLDPAQLQQKREQGYRDWLGKAQADPTKVTFETSATKTAWVSTFIAKGN